MYAKDPYEANYQLLINKSEVQKPVQKPVLKGSKGLIEHSNDTEDIYIKLLKNTIQVRNIKYQSYLMIRLLIRLVIKLNPVVTELFIRGRKIFCVS